MILIGLLIGAFLLFGSTKPATSQADVPSTYGVSVDVSKNGKNETVRFKHGINCPPDPKLSPRTATR